MVSVYGPGVALPANEQIVRAVGPFITHWHPVAAEKIDFDKVSGTFQKGLALTNVLMPTGTASSLIRRRQDLDARDQLAVGMKFMNLQKALAAFGLHQGVHSDWLQCPFGYLDNGSGRGWD